MPTDLEVKYSTCFLSLTQNHRFLWWTDWLHWNAYLCQVYWRPTSRHFPALCYQTKFSSGVRALCKNVSNGVCASRLRHKQECDAGAARTTAAALLDGIPKRGSCIFRNFTNIDTSNERDVSHNWVGSFLFLWIKAVCSTGHWTRVQTIEISMCVVR